MNIYALSGIRTHDLSVKVIKDYASDHEDSGIGHIHKTRVRWAVM
jgi:hypothetical protein